MGVRYAVIDTEARSASKYADRYHFVVDDLKDKSIDGYIKSMQEAYKAGYKVLVIDSLSHAWRELTDEVDRITQASRSQNSFLSWGKVSPKQKRLVDAILNFPGHIIATMRSKTEWVIGQGRNGKNVPEKMGLAPEQGKGIEYEFDLLVEMNQEHQAVVTKDRTGMFQDATIEKPGEDFGIQLYDWLSSGTAPTAISNFRPSSVTPAQAPNQPQANPAQAQSVSTQKAPASSVYSPAPAPATTATANNPPPAKPVNTPPANNCKVEGDAVIQEIAGVIKTADANGQPYFSEAEKEEARQLIQSVNSDAQGVSDLREFRNFLSNMLVERQQPKAKGSTAGLRKAA
jgi:hypothetical protein